MEKARLERAFSATAVGQSDAVQVPGCTLGAVAHALPVAASAAHRSRPVVLLPGLAVLGFVALAASAAATLPPEAARHPRVDAYYLAIGAAFLSYVAALLVLLRARASLAPVLVIAALVQAIPLASPLLLSQDAGVYWDYARIAAVDGGNPYSDPPLRFRSDPAYPSVAGAWRETTSAYGPLFTAASEGGALVVGASPSAARSLFKTAAAVGVVALALLVALVSPRPAFAAAAVGWNPLFAMHFGGGGHNDVWMMVPLVGALALDRRGRRHLAGALWAVAVAVKWIPLLLLPLRTSVRQHSPRFGYAGFAAASLAVAAVASILYGDKWLGGVRAGRPRRGQRVGDEHPLSARGGRYREGARLGCARARLRHRLRRARRRCTEAARAARPCDRVPVARDTVDSALVRELGGSTRRRRGRCRRPRPLGGAHRLPAGGARAAVTANRPHPPVPPPRRLRAPLLALSCAIVAVAAVAAIVIWTTRGGGTTAPGATAAGTSAAHPAGRRRRRHGPSCSSSGQRGHWPLRCRTPRRRRSETARCSSAGLTAADASRGDVRIAAATGDRAAGQLPTAVHDAAAVRIGGFVYVFGGGTDAGTQSDGIVRVPAGGGSGALVARLPSPSSDQAAAVIRGTAYVVGGYTGTRWLDTIVAWRPGAQPRVVARLPFALRYAAVTAASGELVIAGGSLESGSASDVVLTYRPGSARVARIGRLPAATTHAAAAALDGVAYVIGGRGAAVGTPTARIVAIDPRTRRIRAAGLLRSPRSDLAAVSLGDRILLAGGRGNGGTVSRIGELRPRAVAAAHRARRRQAPSTTAGNVYAFDGRGMLTGAARRARPLVYVPNSRATPST